MVGGFGETAHQSWNSLALSTQSGGSEVAHFCALDPQSPKPFSKTRNPEHTYHQVVRRSLKEPMRTKAVVRDNTTMKVATVEKGVKTSVRECFFCRQSRVEGCSVHSCVMGDLGVGGWGSKLQRRAQRANPSPSVSCLGSIRFSLIRCRAVALSLSLVLVQSGSGLSF